MRVIVLGRHGLDWAQGAYDLLTLGPWEGAKRESGQGKLGIDGECLEITGPRG